MTTIQEVQMPIMQEYRRKITAELVLLLEIAEETKNSMAADCITQAIESRPLNEKIDYICDTQEAINSHSKMGNFSRADILRERMYNVYHCMPELEKAVA